MSNVPLNKLDDYYDEIIEKIVKFMQECNDEVIEVICKRLKAIGKEDITATNIHRIIQLARQDDLKRIEHIVSQKTKQSVSEVDNALTEISKSNDELAEEMYIARRMNPSDYTAPAFQAIMQEHSKAIKDGLLNLSGTMAFMLDGKPTELTKAYTNIINRSAYMVQAGFVDYQASIRSAIQKLSADGIQVVDWESGYHRRLDSTVRMNILDGVRQMNQAYREKQGEEFGADGVEISVHFDCAPDHVDVQGKQFTIKEFNKLQETLTRPIGRLNCRHSTFPIIIGLSKPANTKQYIKDAKKNSLEKVTYTDLQGEKKAVTKYEGTQRQREIETSIRRLKEQQQALFDVGDSIGAQELQKKITKRVKHYKQISLEMGLQPDMKRTRIAKN